MITDTHVHLWDPSLIPYPWLADLPELNRPFLLDDYRSASGGADVERMVFVQCEADVAFYRDEVEWVTRLAEEDERIQGIVPWAPLESGDAVAPVLASLAANTLVKGIRRIIQFEPEDDFCLSPGFVEGVQLLAGFGLHFEICIKGDDQYRNVLKLVAQCPDVRFILNHIGKPFIKERLLDPWRGLTKDLAAMPNTWCKVSGVVNEADMLAWTVDDIRPYIEHALVSFGNNRVLFGGDWPVVTLATTYAGWRRALIEVLRGTSDEDLDRLFRSNAIGFYRL